MSQYTPFPAKPVNQVDPLGTVVPLANGTGNLPYGTPDATLVGTLSWSPSAISAGGFASATVPCTGAKVGDRVGLAFVPPLATGLRAFASVGTVDQVAVTVVNETAGPLQPPAATAITASVYKTWSDKLSGPAS